MSEPPCKIGDRIRLLAMPDDPCPIPVGTTGTITGITSGWDSLRGQVQLWVKWDIDRSLALIWPIDSFEVIE